MPETPHAHNQSARLFFPCNSVFYHPLFLGRGVILHPVRRKGVTFFSNSIKSYRIKDHTWCTTIFLKGGNRDHLIHHLHANNTPFFPEKAGGGTGMSSSTSTLHLSFSLVFFFISQYSRNWHLIRFIWELFPMWWCPDFEDSRCLKGLRLAQAPSGGVIAIRDGKQRRRFF